jgi:hypothetical protein
LSNVLVAKVQRDAVPLTALPERSIARPKGHIMVGDLSAADRILRNGTERRVAKGCKGFAFWWCGCRDAETPPVSIFFIPLFH